MKFPFILIIFLFFYIPITLARYGYKGVSSVGKTTCYAINSDSSFFIGTETGGVFQANNTNIDSWTSRSVGLKSGKISSLSYSSKYLFAATADSGVFRYSGKLGSDRFWLPVNNGLSQLEITNIVSLDSITLVAISKQGVVYITYNKGDNWITQNNQFFQTIKVDKIYKVGKRLVVLSTFNGVYYSDDFGLNWETFSISNLNLKITYNSSVYNSSSNEILLTTSDGLYILKKASTTQSGQFTKIETPNSQIISVSLGKNYWYLNTVDGIFGSSTTSLNWLHFGFISPESLQQFIPYYSKFIAFGFSNHIYKCDFFHANLVLSEVGLNNLVTYSTAIRGENLIVNATENGIIVSKNAGGSYAFSNMGIKDSTCIIDIAFKGSKLFAGSSLRGIYISLDSGATWSTFNNGLKDSSIVKLFTSKKYIYLQNLQGDLYRSDGVSSWKLISSDLSLLPKKISFAFTPTRIMLSAYNTGVFIKNELSGDWVDITANLPSKLVTSIVFFGANYFVGLDNGKVFTTDTSYINWKQTSMLSGKNSSLLHLNLTRINCLTAFKGYVFAGTRGTVFATSDEGKTWIDAGNIFNLPSFSNIAKINFTSSRIWVTTDNNFIYSNLLSDLPSIVSINKITYPICGDTLNTGRISVQYTGGKPPYSFTWNTKDSVSTITNLKSGKYIVTITDKNGATASDSVELNLKLCVDPKDTITIPVDSITNNNDSIPTIDSLKNIEEEFLVFPNPSIDLIKIKFNNKSIVHYYYVSSLIGDKILYSDTTFEAKEFSIPHNLKTGVYLFVIQTDTKCYVKRIRVN